MMSGKREAEIGLLLCIQHQDDVLQWALPSVVLLVEYPPCLIVFCLSMIPSCSVSGKIFLTVF